MKKTIGIILWLPITVICLIGKLLIWIGAHAGGVALPVLGVMLILAVFTKNLYAIGIIGVLTIIMIATLFLKEMKAMFLSRRKIVQAQKKAM